MPFLFEPIADYTELLMPDDLLSEGSILQAVRDALTPDACQDEEVIGWLYQFYIAEKKEAVDEKVKAGGKVEPPTNCRPRPRSTHPTGSCASWSRIPWAGCGC
jgi:hypothetical protein